MIKAESAEFVRKINEAVTESLLRFAAADTSEKIAMSAEFMAIRDEMIRERQEYAEVLGDIIIEDGIIAKYAIPGVKSTTDFRDSMYAIGTINGAYIGAVVGAVIGGGVPGAIAGAGLGGMIGGSLGTALGGYFNGAASGGGRPSGGSPFDDFIEYELQ